MKPQHYALTGLRKDRPCTHSPVLLNWRVSTPHVSRELQRRHEKYEQFNLVRITEGVFKRLQNKGFAWEYKMENFFLQPNRGGDRLKDGGILCTEAEYYFLLACELLAVPDGVVAHDTGFSLCPSLVQPHPL